MTDPSPSKERTLSRSKVDLFCQCPRCFWLDKKHGISQPSGAPFTLNNAVDILIKKEFNGYREKQEVPPFLKMLGIEAVPFAHPQIEEWRNNRKGIRHVHEATGLCLYGAVDDVWVLPSGELVIVDYKAKATSGEITLESKRKKNGEIVKTDRYLISYKKQIEFYQWLFRKNGFRVSKTAYFLFANALKDRPTFEDRLTFEKTALLTESVKVRPRQTVINNSTSYIFVRFRTSKDHFVPEDEALEPAKV